MTKAENVVRFYVLCAKLKDIIRTGWKAWNVKRDRLESIAEHIYKVQMLAIAIKYEYQCDIDIEKVVMMLAVHELEEIFIGDITVFEISKEEKKKLGNAAVSNVLGEMLAADKIKALVDEFDAKNTKESVFAYFCDKLECDLQARLYDLEGCVDLNNINDNAATSDPYVKQLMGTGMSFSEMWMTFWQEKAKYDESFMDVSKYAMTHNIFELGE